MGYKESFDQWKEFYIADYKPNLAENVIEEPVENPITHKTEFVKFTLMKAMDIGYISEYLADRVRTAMMKANLTGESPAAGLHDLIIQEIELRDRTASLTPVSSPDSVVAERLPLASSDPRGGGRL